MPHNLYLHSSLVKREHTKNPDQLRQAIAYSMLDLIMALTAAFFVNAAILIISAAVFCKNGMCSITDIREAYYLFTPLLHTSVASFVFAVALLISGQNSTLTGTLAGQVVMEGFVNFSLPAWQRRVLGRLLAIIPALIGIIWYGDCCLAEMMIISQVVLSLQLPFAIFPLIQFTSDRHLMGVFSNSRVLKVSAYAIAGIIVGLNVLLISFFV